MIAAVVAIVLSSVVSTQAQQAAAGAGIPLASSVTYSEGLGLLGGGNSEIEFDLNFVGTAACCRPVTLNTVDCRVFKGPFNVQMSGESIFSDSFAFGYSQITSGKITGMSAPDHLEADIGNANFFRVGLTVAMAVPVSNFKVGDENDPTHILTCQNSTLILQGSLVPLCPTCFATSTTNDFSFEASTVVW
jgi:hypothetical protein